MATFGTWSATASNQMISFSTASQSSFTLKSGQTNPGTEQLMTKSMALAMYNLNASSMSAYADNQLVPKSAWVAAAVGYAFAFSLATYTTASAACADSLSSGQIFYAAENTIANGTQLYTDQNCQNILFGAGSNQYYKTASSNLSISQFGIVSNMTSCPIGYNENMTVYAHPSYGYGYPDSGRGSLTNTSIPLLGNGAVIQWLFWQNDILFLSISGLQYETPPTNWTTISIQGYSYNRSQFEMYYGAPTWYFRLTGASNLFGTTSGVIKTIQIF